MTIPIQVSQLIQTFSLHREAYRSGANNETQLHHEFFDPFFIALGWDIFL